MGSEMCIRDSLDAASGCFQGLHISLELGKIPNGGSLPGRGGSQSLRRPFGQLLALLSGCAGCRCPSLHFSDPRWGAGILDPADPRLAETEALGKLVGAEVGGDSKSLESLR